MYPYCSIYLFCTNSHKLTIYTQSRESQGVEVTINKLNVLLGAVEHEAEFVQRLRVACVNGVGLRRRTELLEDQATERVVPLRTGFGREPYARHFEPMKQ